MEEVLISIGNKDEIAQQAVQYVNDLIVVDWIAIALCVLVVALDISALLLVFNQDIGIKSKVEDSVPLLFILIILISLVVGLVLELSHTYEIRYDISNNTDKAVEYYIEEKWLNRYSYKDKNVYRYNGIPL